MARMNQAMSDLYRYSGALLPNMRSRFNKSHSHSTTFDSGYIIPFMWDRVVPGDEKEIKVSALARMATPIHPVMDEANLDIWAFYVPDRLWWSHAKEFWGENLDADFNPSGEYMMPSVSVQKWSMYDGSGEYVYPVGSLTDYFGLPKVDAVSAGFDDSALDISVGLYRSYSLIWNEWFRNSSIQPSLQLNNGDFVNDDEWQVISQLRKANKYPDMFTTLLREPQAGNDVLLPLGSFAPVITRQQSVDVSSSNIFGLALGDATTGNYLNDNSFLGYNGNNAYLSASEGSSGMPDFEPSAPLFPANLWADLSNASGTTINNLRAAITVQHLLEISNVAGKRYQGLIKAHFGVLVPDSTLQRPELLGASRTAIGMRQVIQTSETSADSPLGNTAAFSVTNMSNEWICNKAFTEPGFIMVLGCVRPVQSYSQGVNSLLQKLAPYDHYYPVFDRLGNQPVYNKEIYADSAEASTLNGVFGYKAAWLEYKTMPNRVSGLMRPDIAGNLSSWNYSVVYNETPILNSEFVAVDPDFIDRTIATPDEPQFICDCYFEYFDTKTMSVNPPPGLTTL